MKSKDTRFFYLFAVRFKNKYFPIYQKRGVTYYVNWRPES